MANDWKNLSSELVRIARLIYGYSDKLSKMLRKYHMMSPGPAKKTMWKYLEKMMAEEDKKENQEKREEKSGYEVIKNSKDLPDRFMKGYKGYAILGSESGEVWFEDISMLHENFIKYNVKEIFNGLSVREKKEVVKNMRRDYHGNKPKVETVERLTDSFLPDVKDVIYIVIPVVGRVITEGDRAGEMFLWEDWKKMDDLVKKVEKKIGMSVTKVYVQ